MDKQTTGQTRKWKFKLKYMKNLSFQCLMDIEFDTNSFSMESLRGIPSQVEVKQNSIQQRELASLAWGQYYSANLLLTLESL